MDEQELKHDQALAAFTDALLEGQMDEHGERPPLASAVQVLARAMGPEAPPQALRQRVHRAVAEEWRREHPSAIEQLVRWIIHPRRRVWAAAGAMLVAVLALAALFVPSSTGGGFGTAVDSSKWFLVVAFVALIVFVAVEWWRSRR
ncbi:MAG: hypothetical protein JXD18_03900 [Anaerolineae bacterium]|nr:hypothetical protein [Anaerolineae bacterium]